jgi:hypothetical protein
MLAHAILTVREHARPVSDHSLIPLTVPEIRRLFSKLIANTIRTIDRWLHWSTWRRRHQHRTRTSHYRRRSHATHRPAST